MRKSYVYKITCLVTSEYYFGSSFNAKSDRYWGGGKRIRERIAQYGKENFIKEILGEYNDRTIAHQVENKYIEKFRNDDKCLNQQLDHKFGTYSDKSRAKIGVAHHVENLSDDTRSKLSAANRGEKNPMYGKIFSEETRERMSVSHLGIFRGKHWRKNPVTGKREWYD